MSDSKEQAATNVGKEKEKEKEEVVDSFVFEAPGVDEPDMFKLEIDSFPIVRPYKANDFVSYETLCVRIGKKKSGLLVLGRLYQIRYGQWLKLTDKLVGKAKDEKKELKLPVIPEEHLLGTYCCCLHRDWDPHHRGNMVTWIGGVQKEIGISNSTIADHFYMGDNYKNQQVMRLVFMKAYAASARELGVTAWGDLPPFDEGEAVVQLCQQVLIRDFLPKVLHKVPNVGPLRWRFEWTAAGTVYALTDAAISSVWVPAQKVLDEIKNGITKILDDGGKALIDQLEPVLVKVFELVESKMPKGDDKDKAPDTKEEQPPLIGSVVKDWRFEKSDIGKKFFDALVDAKEAREAVPTLRRSWEGAMSSVFHEKFAEGVTAACNPNFARSGIVKLILKGFTAHLVRTFKNYTAVDPVLKALEPLDTKRWALEDALIKAKDNKEGLEKTVNDASADMWRTLPDAGLALFKELASIKGRIRNEMRDEPREAAEALTAVADHMFHIQMRAINALRAQFTISLKQKLVGEALASAESVALVVRTTWRDILFQLVQIVVKEGWEKMTEALTEAAFQIAMAEFFKTVWEPICKPLQALQDKMPGPLAKLDILGLAQTVAEKIIQKGVTFAMTKILGGVEGFVFKQA